MLSTSGSYLGKVEKVSDNSTPVESKSAKRVSFLVPCYYSIPNVKSGVARILSNQIIACALLSLHRRLNYQRLLSFHYLKVWR
jgi:hypothetical protein